MEWEDFSKVSYLLDLIHLIAVVHRFSLLREVLPEPVHEVRG